MSNYQFELISFSLCPYVQRSVITLKYKKVPYKITLIDLENPPAWFDKISPMGQVPVLKVTEGNKETAVFESAVINEFLDETAGKRMLSEDALIRASERAWIAFGSELLRQSYMIMHQTDREALKPMLDELFTDLGRLENVISKEGPFFGGRELGLVDTSYAPMFMRMFLVEGLNPDAPQGAVRWKDMPRVKAWAKAMMALPEVRDSVHPEFAKEYLEYCRELGGAIFQ